MLLKLRWRDEVIERIKQIDVIRENCKDAIAEQEEARKRDPLVRTRSRAETAATNTGGERQNIAILLSERDDNLELQIAQYNAIIYDFDKGWRSLNECEKTVLIKRFKKGKSQNQVAFDLKKDERTIRRIESEALRKMELHMIKY